MSMLVVACCFNSHSCSSSTFISTAANSPPTSPPPPPATTIVSMLKAVTFAIEGADPEFFVFRVNGLKQRLAVSWRTASDKGRAIPGELFTGCIGAPALLACVLACSCVLARARVHACLVSRPLTRERVPQASTSSRRAAWPSLPRAPTSPPSRCPSSTMSPGCPSVTSW